jgi:hypothetical protein
MALNMREALSGKFLNGGVQGVVHGPIIHEERDPRARVCVS